MLHDLQSENYKDNKPNVFARHLTQYTKSSPDIWGAFGMIE